MNKYESVIILKPDLNKKEIEEIVLKVENKIKEFAEITDKKDYGIRKLAYEIHKNKEGHYIMHQFELNNDSKGDSISELERLYKILDEIIKFIVVKL